MDVLNKGTNAVGQFYTMRNFIIGMIISSVLCIFGGIFVNTKYEKFIKTQAKIMKVINTSEIIKKDSKTRYSQKLLVKYKPSENIETFTSGEICTPETADDTAESYVYDDQGNCKIAKCKTGHVFSNDKCTPAAIGDKCVPGNEISGAESFIYDENMMCKLENCAEGFHKHDETCLSKMDDEYLSEIIIDGFVKLKENEKIDIEYDPLNVERIRKPQMDPKIAGYVSLGLGTCCCILTIVVTMFLSQNKTARQIYGVSSAYQNVKKMF